MSEVGPKPGSEPTALSAFSESVARTGRLVAIAGAVCYALGLTVVNIHFGKFGYSSFGLVRTSYITGGLWALLVLWMSIVVVLLLRAHFMDVRGTRMQRLLKYGLRGLLSLSLAMGFAVQIGRSLRCGGASLLWAILAGLILIGAFWQTTPDPPKTHGHPTRWFYESVRQRSLSAPIVLPWLITSGLLFLGAISDLWGRLPIAFGGGRPQTVAITVDSTLVARRTLEVGGLAPDSTWVVRGLLLTREDNYFVLSGFRRRSATMLPAAAIRAVTYDPKTASEDSTLAAHNWVPVKRKPRWYELLLN